MTVETEADELVILLREVMPSIGCAASKLDPGRADRYATVDVARVRRAVARVDDLLAGIRRWATDDEKAMDMALAQAMLIHACVLLPRRTGEADAC